VRDLILLELFRTGSPRCVAEAWACLGVQPQVKESITQVMKGLQTRFTVGAGEDTFLLLPFHLHELANASVIQPILQAWLNSTLELKDFKRDFNPMTLLRAEALSQAAASTASKQCSLAVAQQIKTYLKTLSVGSKATTLNITMLEAPALLSTLYFSSLIYRATNSAEPFVFNEDQVDAMKSALNSGQVQIKIKCCDVLELPCVFGIAHNGQTATAKPFDVVDFTNVAGYVGLGTVLGLGSLLTKSNIYVQQMRWDRDEGCTDMKRYLAKCLG